MTGISKELNLQFVLGYEPGEFAAALRHLAAGSIPAAELVTGRVGIDGVAQAFQDLASPAALRRALALGRRLGALHQAVSYHLIARSCEPARRRDWSGALPEWLGRLLDGLER